MDISAGSVWILTVPVHPARVAQDDPTTNGYASTWVLASRAERQAIAEALRHAGRQTVWQRGEELESRLRLAASTSIPSPPAARELCPAIEASDVERARGAPERLTGALTGQVWEGGLCVFCGNRWQDTWASPWYPHPSICDECARTLPSQAPAGSATMDGDDSTRCSWCFSDADLLDVRGTRSPDTPICFDCADRATIELDIPDEDEEFEFQYDSISIGPSPIEDDPDSYMEEEGAEDYEVLESVADDGGSADDDSAWFVGEGGELECIFFDPPDGKCDICGSPLYGAMNFELNLCAECQRADERATATEGAASAFTT